MAQLEMGGVRIIILMFPQTEVRILVLLRPSENFLQ